ncbi:esterase OVCA2 isoform X2 [Lycorma delicatula]|uniref:esterase OVCA2 isoform X2 n=1 Tax=Lycorma delicatula TaxID=130591 RepID=UPI003F5165A5
MMSTFSHIRLTLTAIKILCLHGYRQNKDVFREKLGQFRKNLKQHAEFYFTDAPHVVSIQNAPTAVTGVNADERSWWFTSEDNTYQSKLKTNFCIGLEDSLIALKKIVSEEGPFDGILGFSQGAALTAIICGLIGKNALPFKIRFVIIVAGFKSLYDGHTDLYTKINIPSLHVIGENDEVIHQDRSRELLSVFEDSKVLIHPGGHYVPASKDLKEKYIDFLSTIRNSIPS